MRETHMKRLIDGIDIITTDPTPLSMMEQSKMHERDLRL